MQPGTEHSDLPCSRRQQGSHPSRRARLRRARTRPRKLHPQIGSSCLPSFWAGHQSQWPGSHCPSPACPAAAALGRLGRLRLRLGRGRMGPVKLPRLRWSSCLPSSRAGLPSRWVLLHMIWRLIGCSIAGPGSICATCVSAGHHQPLPRRPVTEPCCCITSPSQPPLRHNHDAPGGSETKSRFYQCIQHH